MKIITVLFLILSSALHVSAQAGAGTKTALQTCGQELQWMDAKPPMPPGAKVAIVEGNPKAGGHFTLRFKLPPYYKIPVHSHPVDERTTVLSGEINVAVGEVMDTTKAARMTAGCFYLNPAGVFHYAFTSDKETEVQISTNGPWGLEIMQK